MAFNDQAMITVHVHPNAARSQIVGFRDEVLHIKVTAPPVEGRANTELVELLSDVLQVRKSNVTIERGASGRRKIVAVSGLAREQIIRVLSDMVG